MPTEISYCSLLVDLAAGLPELWETPDTASAGTAKEPTCVVNTHSCCSFWIFCVCSIPLRSCALFLDIANKLLVAVSKMVIRDLFIQLHLVLLLVS